MMNVIGYVRVSTQGQAKDGYSLAYQQDDLIAPPYGGYKVGKAASHKRYLTCSMSTGTLPDCSLTIAIAPNSQLVADYND